MPLRKKRNISEKKLKKKWLTSPLVSGLDLKPQKEGEKIAGHTCKRAIS